MLEEAGRFMDMSDARVNAKSLWADRPTADLLPTVAEISDRGSSMEKCRVRLYTGAVMAFSEVAGGAEESNYRFFSTAAV